ncbi:MAG: 3-coathanger stack domain-containing protein, partial [Bacteroidota bacterium]
GMGDPCPLNFTLSYNPSDMDTVSASNTLATTGAITIADGTQVVFRAGTSITLAPDFVAELGSDFTAYMEDCSASSSVGAPGNGKAEVNGKRTKGIKFRVFERIRRLFS